MRRPSTPLTAVGGLAAALAVVGYVAGWQLGWIELLVLSAACALALVAALPFVIGRLRVDLHRTLSKDRVTVGTTSEVTLDVTNPRSTAVRSRIIDDFNGVSVVPWPVPRLGAGATHRIEYRLDTSRRGRFQIGPAVIARTDPLRLMRREVRQAGTDTLWVHPRHDLIGALPVGFAKDLEGPTSDTSPIGDVAFHSLRSYQPGDDFRHIHWMSTARTGSPMVRHYVDNRRPHLGVLLDDRIGSMTPDRFEVAVEIAASMSVSALSQREPVAVWTAGGPLVGGNVTGGPDDVLDRLALAEQQRGPLPDEAAAELVRSERGVSAVAFVTGGVDTADLLEFIDGLRRRVRVIIIRVWSPSALQHDSLPGAHLIDVDSLASFIASWEQMNR